MQPSEEEPKESSERTLHEALPQLCERLVACIRTSTAHPAIGLVQDCGSKILRGTRGTVLLEWVRMISVVSRQSQESGLGGVKEPIVLLILGLAS